MLKSLLDALLACLQEEIFKNPGFFLLIDLHCANKLLINDDFLTENTLKNPKKSNKKMLKNLFLFLCH